MPTAGHVLRAYLPRSETFVYTLLRHHSRWTPAVLTERVEHRDEFPLDPVDVVGGPAHAPRRALRRLRALAAGSRSTWDHELASAARRRGAALLHGHFGPVGWRALGASRRLGVPLVTTFYGFDLAFARERPEWAPRYEELFAHGRLFLCEGPAMADHLASIGCPRERIELLPIAVDLERFAFQPRTRGAGPLVVVATGRFVEKKGFDDGVRAFARALPELGDAELWLIGDGPERPRIEAAIADCGAGGRVRLLGMLAHDAYRDALARAHVGLVPSRTARDGDTEGGAPTVLLEMQASGMPVVATRHADIPAVVGRPGELAPEGDVDALAARLAAVARSGDDDWRARLADGRAHVERRHAAERVGERLEALYDALTA